jgi:hypothetical protein
MKTDTLRHATIGTIVSATLRLEDLLPAFITELEYLQTRNGGFLSLPENFPFRDSIARAIGEAQDCFDDGGETIRPDMEDAAADLVNETLPDLISAFSPPYCSFHAHPGDGSDFGHWPDMEAIEWLPVVEDSDEAKELGDDCKSVNCHGNVTVYSGTGEVLLELV